MIYMVDCCRFSQGCKEVPPQRIDKAVKNLTRLDSDNRACQLFGVTMDWILVVQ
jgi:hypothetical protein